MDEASWVRLPRVGISLVVIVAGNAVSSSCALRGKKGKQCSSECDLGGISEYLQKGRRFTV